MKSLIPQTIFITGCSSGIGLEALRTLTQRGHRVIGSCRKQKDVDTLIEQGFEAVQLDVSCSQSIAAGLAVVLNKTNGQIDVLINNAGYGQAGALEDIHRQVLNKQFETNVFGLMELTQLVIPIMRKKNYGRIINMSSVLGLISMPFRGAYNASKYAVEGICDTLRLELHHSGIKVICIEPGPIESQFRNHVVDDSLQHLDITQSVFQAQYQNMLTSFKQQKEQSFFTQHPQAVVKKLIHAIESKHPKAKYPVTFPTYLFIILKRLLPTSMLDGFLRFISKKRTPIRIKINLFYSCRRASNTFGTCRTRVSSRDKLFSPSIATVTVIRVMFSCLLTSV